MSIRAWFWRLIHHRGRRRFFRCVTPQDQGFRVPPGATRDEKLKALTCIYCHTSNAVLFDPELFKQAWMTKP